jgi:hypothetical protein
MSRRSKTTTIVPAVLVIGLTLLVWQGMTGFSATLNAFEGLSVSAPTTTLHVGESTQVTVHRKRGFFFHRTLQRPDTTTYFTVSESELVVEPDGQVTCVGTGGRTKDEIWISADNDRDTGHISLNLLPGGPGPMLDFVAADVPKPAAIPDYFVRYAPCCSGDPIVMTEGQTIRYKVVRHVAPFDDVTAKAVYTVFFGSGVPNDIRPSVITGGHDYVTSRNFHIDAQHGTISAPASIGRDNRDSVVIFARNGNLVGWKYIVITHVEEDGREGHLRLHPEER